MPYMNLINFDKPDEEYFLIIFEYKNKKLKKIIFVHFYVKNKIVL